MRILATVAVVVLSLLSVACAVTLQPSQQGEWSNFHKVSHKTAQEPAVEKAASEK